MFEIDGSAGGGQIVRSALALSMLTGEAVEISDVRGGRSTPGLKAQHRTVVETAAAICDADVKGAEQAAETVTFEPGAPSGGRYEAAVGTAGSVTLLFDALLPLATRLDEPLTVTATGGTDVKWSPPMAYYRAVKLPLLRRFGLAAAVECDRTGFYPAGGGEATLHLWPSSLSPIDLPERGDITGGRIYSKASDDLADAEVAERQASAAVEGLRDAEIDVVERRSGYVESSSAGSVVVIRLDADGGCAGFDAYGEPGKPAEDVAADAVSRVRRYRQSGAAVDEHLADQLLVFLALAGGRLAISEVTDHVDSSLDLLAAFGRPLTVTDAGASPVVAGDR